MAEKERFELSIRYKRIHTFQACAFNHSAISPHKTYSPLYVAQDKPDSVVVQLLIAKLVMNRYSKSMELIDSLFSVVRFVRNLIRFCLRNIEVILVLSLIFIAAIQYYVRPQSQSLGEILKTGKLRVLIADEPDSQYVLNRQHFGFEYELLAAFADDLGVDLALEVVPYGELFALLDSGAGDIAVGGIIDSLFVRRVSSPSIAWYQAQTTVVYKRGTKRPKKLEDLGKEEVLTSARYFDIEHLQSLNLIDDHRSEYALLSAVDNGSERFVLSVNYRALNAKHYLPNLNRSFILPDLLDVVWALPKRADQPLSIRLNSFLQSALEQKIPTQLANDYFKSPTRLTIYDALAVHKKIETVFPEFEYAFKRAARKGGIDWQLLAAMGYQESHWSNAARSPTGVRGVMQLTTSTALALGVEDRMDMNQSIDAAALYIKQLKRRLPEKIKEPQRTWFAVGAYNVGMKHILAAYRKARDKGLDRTQWETISKLLPTLYGEHFERGIQAQKYVERVQIFTDIMRFYDIHQRSTDKLKKGVVTLASAK
jgi:membrane-bound lytic murein transglycosylase F